MKTRYTADKIRYKTMTTDELRENFLIDYLFREGEILLEYCEIERAIVGSAVPTKKPLKLKAGKELAAEYFCQRREVGILNTGNKGKITVDGTEYEMSNLDCLYIGRGSSEVSLESDDSSEPAKYYILSHPAHTEYPTRRTGQSEATTVNLGSQKEANVRTIYKYIHPDGIKSCQLMMGVTFIEEGSVWNTMPPHTHERRTEIYLYFNMDEKAAVFHLMGPAEETRHMVVRNRNVVVSPMWSIHSGAGTSSYAFCWGMGGENQDFDDMDHIRITDIK